MSLCCYNKNELTVGMPKMIEYRIDSFSLLSKMGKNDKNTKITCFICMYDMYSNESTMNIDFLEFKCLVSGYKFEHYDIVKKIIKHSSIFQCILHYIILYIYLY